MRIKYFRIAYIISSVLMSGLSIGIMALAQSTSARPDQDYCGEPGFEPDYRTIQCPIPSATPEADLPNVPMDAGGRDYQPPVLPSVGDGHGK